MKNKIFLFGMGLLLLMSMTHAMTINASWNGVTALDSNSYAYLDAYGSPVLKGGSTNLSYNISICANGTQNITYVNISLPLGINYINGTNVTNATTSNFTLISGQTKILNWNATVLIPAGGCRNFQFSSTVTSAVINLTFQIAGFNATAAYVNLSAKADLSAPTVTINSPTSGAQIHGLSNDVTYTAVDDVSSLMLCTTTYDGLGATNFTLTGTPLTNTYVFAGYGSQRCITVSCMDAIGNIGTSGTVCIFPVKPSARGYQVVSGCGSTDANINYGQNSYPQCCPAELPTSDGVTCVAGLSTVQAQAQTPLSAVTPTTLASSTAGDNNNNKTIAMVAIILVLVIGAVYVERGKN